MRYNYVVYYGRVVPYQQMVFTRFADASKFIKQQLDYGVEIRAVLKELSSETDDDQEYADDYEAVYPSN